jgi:hypothetical protein
MERKVLKGVLPGAASGAENCNSGSLAEMDTPTTEQILKRAYEIWEKNNKTEGRDEEFYHQAEQDCVTRTDLRRCAHRITFRALRPLAGPLGCNRLG